MSRLSPAVLTVLLASSCSAPPRGSPGPARPTGQGSDAEARIPATASSTSSSSDVDASILISNAADAGKAAGGGVPGPDAGNLADGGISFLAWSDAEACKLPPVNWPRPILSPKDQTAERCCHPESSVTVCLRTASQADNHTLGAYTERTLTVGHVSNAQPALSFPLDRHEHGSMKHRDAVMARLSFRVHDAGLELRVREGCQNVCTGARCNTEQKLVAGICASAGMYGWDGERLVRQ